MTLWLAVAMESSEPAPPQHGKFVDPHCHVRSLLNYGVVAEVMVSKMFITFNKMVLLPLKACLSHDQCFGKLKVKCRVTF